MPYRSFACIFYLTIFSTLHSGNLFANRVCEPSNATSLPEALCLKCVWKTEKLHPDTFQGAEIAVGWHCEALTGETTTIITQMEDRAATWGRLPRPRTMRHQRVFIIIVWDLLVVLSLQLSEERIWNMADVRFCGVNVQSERKSVLKVFFVVCSFHVVN